MSNHEKTPPPNMAGTGEKRMPTVFKQKAEKEVSANEIEARRTARSRSVDAFTMTPHPLQPAQRHSGAAVVDLVESIRQLGLLEPPLVWRRSDGKYVILAGHRRWRAWRILAAEGAVKPRMRVYVIAGIGTDEALKIVAAEYFQRTEYSVCHKAQLVGEAHRAMQGANGDEVPLRTLAAVLPIGRTSVNHYLTIHEGLQDPRLAPLVHSVDKPSKMKLYNALNRDGFSAKLAALEALQPTAKKVAKATSSATKPTGKGGRPSQAAVRETRGRGFDLAVRVRVRMSEEEVQAVRVALERALLDLGRLHPQGNPGEQEKG